MPVGGFVGEGSRIPSEKTDAENWKVRGGDAEQTDDLRTAETRKGRAGELPGAGARSSS